MPTLNFDTLTPEQRQTMVDVVVSGAMKEAMGNSLLQALASGGPPVDTFAYFSPKRAEHIARTEMSRCFRSWKEERRLVESPGRMTIDAEYEVSA